MKSKREMELETRLEKLECQMKGKKYKPAPKKDYLAVWIVLGVVVFIGTIGWFVVSRSNSADRASQEMDRQSRDLGAHYLR